MIASLRAKPPVVEPITDSAIPPLLHISEELDRICKQLARSTSFSTEMGDQLLKLETLARSLEQIARDQRPAPP